ncbi:MAG TPA: aldehyde:ferredoxin oxidoreductase, partial [Bacteroidales bacterium]|nr:aldehyde:ferredoxin oxidoreductase [Bacteroidales bacterium]
LAAEPHKIPEHVDNYVAIYQAVTGNPFSKEELIRQSERVYNFQRVFNLRRGYGKRIHDQQPYRAAGPVTAEEYESRAERYDKQLKELLGIEPSTKTTKEKVAILRKHREAQYEKLVDAVYHRRGWTPNGVPTKEHLKNIGMDLPEVLEVVSEHL